MRLGHGQRRTVVMLWLWTALLSGAALVPTYTNEGNALVPFVAAGLALALFALFHPGVRVAREQLNGPPTRPGRRRARDVVDLDSARRKRA